MGYIIVGVVTRGKRLKYVSSPSIEHPHIGKSYGSISISTPKMFFISFYPVGEEKEHWYLVQVVTMEMNE